MPHERNSSGLIRSAREKSQETLERTDQAINRLVKEGKKINFHTVAEAAGVSIAYLYKHDTVKQRIDHLRKQQSPIKGLPQKQSASNDSKQAIITTFKKRIQELQAEIKGLRDHIEVAQGIAMQVPELKQQIAALKQENSKLKEQLNDCHRASESQSNPIPLNNSKIASLAWKKTKQVNISDRIKSELAKIGIKANSTLINTMKSTSEELVLGAIEALKEAMDNGNIEKPGGWLNKAIKESWSKNEKHFQKLEIEIFNEWYNLAKKQGIIMTSMKGDDGKLYVFTPDGLRLPFEQMLVEYPLDVLRRG